MVGHWVKVVQPVQFQKGYNELVLLSQTVGLQVKYIFLPIFGYCFLLIMYTNCFLEDALWPTGLACLIGTITGNVDDISEIVYLTIRFLQLGCSSRMTLVTWKGLYHEE